LSGAKKRERPGINAQLRSVLGSPLAPALVSVRLLGAALVIAGVVLGQRCRSRYWLLAFGYRVSHPLPDVGVHKKGREPGIEGRALGAGPEPELIGRRFDSQTIVVDALLRIPNRRHKRRVGWFGRADAVHQQ